MTSKAKKITDKERLDWLDAHGIEMKMDLGGGWYVEYADGQSMGRAFGAAPRAAIDAAILAERKGER